MSSGVTETVLITGGDFLMGDDGGESDERPKVLVRVQPFLIDVHPVTNVQFHQFLLANAAWRPSVVGRDLAEESYLNLWHGTEFPEHLSDYALINVSWFAARAYAHWVGKRLPTEAEWEFAAGGPEHTRYSLGDAFDPTDYSFAIVDDPIGFPVKQYRPNGFGLFDMSGGVWEWTQDYYDHDAYAQFDPQRPVNDVPSDRRTLRGGANTFTDPHFLRCAMRGRNLPAAAHEDYGFRCAVDV